MSGFLIFIMVVFIVSANIIAVLSYMKKRNLYSAAFIILLLAAAFGGIGGVVALLIIRDPFAVFYGLQVAYFLLINSIIAFIIAILVTLIKIYNKRTA
ncbi:3-isopropylmalate dehydrogenase [Jeotgalibacillus proteolyticus]|uniref:3-isopropylmalate dehydrogenase n=1 Tax=Jeotgalibacillus proteolyticus TaxID=2082395 RepID=UPI003CE8B440